MKADLSASIWTHDDDRQDSQRFKKTMHPWPRPRRESLAAGMPIPICCLDPNCCSDCGLVMMQGYKNFSERGKQDSQAFRPMLGARAIGRLPAMPMMKQDTSDDTIVAVIRSFLTSSCKAKHEQLLDQDVPTTLRSSWQDFCMAIFTAKLVYSPHSACIPCPGFRAKCR